MIYFIQDTRSKAIKIGTSRNPAARLKELQTAHAHPLVLLAVMDGGVTEERELHQRFTRLHGEWFEPTPELNVFVREYAMRMPQVRMAAPLPVRHAEMAPMPAGELTPIDLSTCGYPNYEIWTAAMLSVNVRNGEYVFSAFKIAKFMTVGGTREYREKKLSDIQRMVFTIRSMPTADVDRILMDAPPEVQETEVWQMRMRGAAAH
jgi:hypothetical protein